VEVRFAYQTNCWGPLGGNAVGVTSIGQLTYVTYGDIDRAIAEIAAAGYQGVELFDGNVQDYPGGAKALRAALDDVGVELLAVYPGANFIFPDILDEELGRIARTADAAAHLSAKHLVIGGGAKRLKGVSHSDYERLAEGLDKAAALAKARGSTPITTRISRPSSKDQQSRPDLLAELDRLLPGHRPSRGGRRRRSSDDPQAPRADLLRPSQAPAA
jgi:inosose dehydratase